MGRGRVVELDPGFHLQARHPAASTAATTQQLFHRGAARNQVPHAGHKTFALSRIQLQRSKTVCKSKGVDHHPCRVCKRIRCDYVHPPGGQSGGNTCKQSRPVLGHQGNLMHRVSILKGNLEGLLLE